ncbi:SGNH/GDSL hydrolase family protein [bacterium]|nr:SGNH/GDSL hydrolase family protein [bacterium]
MLKIRILSMMLLLGCLPAFAMAQTPCSNCVAEVLHIGDSQTDLDFGKKMYGFLTSIYSKKEVQVLGVSSSSPRHWASRKGEGDAVWLCSQFGRVGGRTKVRMQGELCDRQEFASPFAEANRDTPKHVFFQFLGNSMWLTPKQIKKNVKLLLGHLKDTQKCFFMTSPPYHLSLGEKNELRLKTEEYVVQAVGGRCTVFRGMTLDQLAQDNANYHSDLVHLNASGAEKFLEAIRPSVLNFLKK